MVEKKEDWEKKEIKSASISLKKTISFSLSLELTSILENMGINKFTSLYNDFLLKESGLSKSEFDEKVIDFIQRELCDIKGRSNSRKFRKYLAEYIMKNIQKKELKERMKEYVEKEQYI